MSIEIALLAGAALGLLGAAPLLFVLHKALQAKRGLCAAPSVPFGFAAVVQSGLIVTLGIYAAYLYVPEHLVLLSTTAVLGMLAIILVYGLVVWRKMLTL